MSLMPFNDELYYLNFILQVFHRDLITKGATFPVILWTDNHKSHFSLEISKLCKRLKIILIGLSPNSTSFLQPNDQLFGKLKQKFLELLRIQQQKTIDFKITLENFPTILQEALNLSLVEKPNFVRWAFKTTGICPFNPDVIDYSKLKTKSDDNNAFSFENIGKDSLNPDFLDHVLTVDSLSSPSLPQIENFFNEDSFDEKSDSDIVRILIDLI